MMDDTPPRFLVISSFVHLSISLYFPHFLLWAHITVIGNQARNKVTKKTTQEPTEKLSLAIPETVMLAPGWDRLCRHVAEAAGLLWEA